jgi:hypothetical protein
MDEEELNETKRLNFERKYKKLKEEILEETKHYMFLRLKSKIKVIKMKQDFKSDTELLEFLMYMED